MLLQLIPPLMPSRPYRLLMNAVKTTIATAAEVLIGQLDTPIKPRPIVRLIEPELMVRESTGPARAE